MRASLPLLALVLGLGALCPAPRALLAQDSPPAPKPGSPPSDLTALRKELEATYLQIHGDFDALTGEKSAERFAALEKAVARELEARKPKALKASDYPDLWTGAKLLGPVVAKRLADRMAEVLAKSGSDGTPTPGFAEAVRAAAKLVFPEATMADNWDKQFLDLDIVQRWAKANAGAAPTGDRRPEPGKGSLPPAPDPSDMVLIPKGDLSIPENRGRGWPNLDQKAEKHALKAFYLDRTEVTCAAYAAFLRDLKDARLREKLLPTGWKLDEKGLPALAEAAAALPVSGITYEGAAAFAASLGKRLPSEDEWERAARGNLGLKFTWGNDWVDGNAVVDGKPGPAPVGTTPNDRSAFGVMDLVGNVSELCATYLDGKSVKGLPKQTEQVVRRGGNFKEPADEAANDWRYVIGPTARSELVGFRCAMDEKDYERRYGKK